MRERLTIFLTIALVLTLLVALNAASYVRVEQPRDSEFNPDRSTTNVGATGTRAFYEFLHESGHKVVRWRESLLALLKEDGARPATFVVIGKVRREFEREEARGLLRWVRDGGRLVLIDRVPDTILLPTSGHWRVASEIFEFPDPTVHPDDVESMTHGVKPLAPAQPASLMRDVQEVMRSRFASRLHLYTVDERPTLPASGEEDDDDMPPPVAPDETPPPSVGIVLDDSVERPTESSPAPVEYLPDGREGNGALLVDYAYGRGRIIILSDPFIVSNTGLRLADNLQLATNLVADVTGEQSIIAFDEYHQGRGMTQNPTFAYFRGTPALAIAAQLGLLLLAFVWTRSRRFARPLPAPHVDRRSNLEFVASMAELQQRARAYDLAIENIYGRTRRALARYAGVAATARSNEIAQRVAARSGRDMSELEALLGECEDAIAGAPISARRTLEIIARLRELEGELGIRMRSREIRQARAL